MFKLDFHTNERKHLLIHVWTLSIVQILNNLKTQRFGNWIYFVLQLREKDPYSMIEVSAF
jgi:hypothetical protein